jgi:predicted DsbA family dithiol-disulfide isomerase
MSTHLRIDFVSDISCPWCAIGLASLERALERLGGAVQADIHFAPFELNPHMPPGGQEIGEHIAQKYGRTPEQQRQARDAIRERGASVGFEFRPEGRDRIYNTFDAHRLLYWAGSQGPGRQLALKKALFGAYFTQGRSPAEHEVLVDAAVEAGLDGSRAREVLTSDEFAQEVRAEEEFFTSHGIHAVPAVIVNRHHLIQGGHPPDVFEQALREIARA